VEGHFNLISLLDSGVCGGCAGVLRFYALFLIAVGAALAHPNCHLDRSDSRPYRESRSGETPALAFVFAFSCCHSRKESASAFCLWSEQGPSSP